MTTYRFNIVIVDDGGRLRDNITTQPTLQIYNEQEYWTFVKTWSDLFSYWTPRVSKNFKKICEAESLAERLKAEGKTISEVYSLVEEDSEEDIVRLRAWSPREFEQALRKALLKFESGLKGRKAADKARRKEERQRARAERISREKFLAPYGCERGATKRSWN